LNLVACSETLCSENIRLFAGFIVLNEGNVTRTAGVILDSKNGLRAWFVPIVVDEPNPASMAATTVTDGYLAALVPAASAALCNCQLANGVAFPEVGVDGSLKMP
jgi:hypothetical protein